MTAKASEWENLCIVCGKSVDHGGGMCHLKFEETMIALCCPLCLETFNRDSKTYLRRRAAHQVARDLLPPGSAALFDP